MGVLAPGSVHARPYDNFSIFVTPQYVIVQGVGGGLDFFFDWNVILLVT